MNKSEDFKFGNIAIINGILECEYHEMKELDLETTKYLVKKRIDFSNGKSYPCLFDISKIKFSSKETRDYLANEGSELVSASALLVNSLVVKMAANFFVSVNKPTNPTRVFIDKESAREWLKQYI